MMTENILSHHFLIKKVDPISSNMFITKKNIIHYFFLVLAIIVSMLILKISSSQIIILLGGIGFGLGFGLKFVIENLISGLLIILNKVIFVGENIQIISDGADMIAEGRVLDIYSMNTVIVEMNNEKIIVPNSIISKNTIKKITHFENHSIDHQE